MKKELRVLIVEDDEDDFFLLQQFLNHSKNWNFKIDHAKYYDDGLVKYTENNFDLCFLDYYLGANTALDFLTQIENIEQKIPVILLTGLDNQEIDEIVIKAGAADYIPKSYLSQEILERSIRHSLERNDQQNMLRKQKEKYRNLFEHSLEAIFITDSEFNILEVNESFKILMKHDSFSQQPLSSIFKSDEDFKLLSEDIEAIGSKNLKRTLIKNNEGKELVVNITLSALYKNYEDQETNYQGVIHDITRLEQTQLRLLEIEKLNLTGRMARIIGHEVRNPLTNIVLATDELIDSVELVKEDDAELFEMIKRNTKRITNLIDDLLNSTKLLELNVVNCELEHLLNTALDTCKDRIQLKKIELVAFGLNEHTFCKVDSDKFRIALVNIIINATEALSEKTNPLLEVGLEKNENRVDIIIRDNGCGMSQETLQKIYDPFFSAKQGGLGLGMTNVKNIMIQHNVLLHVESEVGKGSTFRIKLDLVQAPE